MNVLDELEEIKELVNDDKKFKYKGIVNFNCESVEKSLNALETIKEKPQAELSLIQLGKIKTYEEYLKYTKQWDLEYWDMIYEEEEFNLLKEVLE